MYIFLQFEFVITYKNEAAYQLLMVLQHELSLVVICSDTNFEGM